MDAITTKSWGDNSFSQAPGTIDGQWQHIAAGPETSLFLRNGKLWALGPNKSHCLSEEKDSLDTMSRVDLPELEVFKLRAISCGRDHFVSIDDKGFVISWGANNEFGQVGHSESGTLTRILPRVVVFPPTFGHRIRQVSCGEYHTLALAETGQVWSWGANTYGQLGVGDFKEHCAPTMVEHALACFPVRQISAGSYHSVCRVITGEAYSWGKNNLGQLGLGLEYDAQKSIQIPLKIADLECSNSPLRSVAAGGSHTAFLYRSGCVSFCGDNRHGQLGQDPAEVEYSHLPLLICEGPIVNMRVRHVVLGEFHSLLLAESHDFCVLFGMGLNTEGQCGPGPQTIWTPHRISLTQLDASSFDEPDLPVDEGMSGIVCGLSVGSRHNIAMLKMCPSPELELFQAAEFLRASSVPEDVISRSVTEGELEACGNSPESKRMRVELPVVPGSHSDGDDDMPTNAEGELFAFPRQRRCHARSQDITVGTCLPYQLSGQIRRGLQLTQKIIQTGVYDGIQFWTLTTSELGKLASEATAPNKRVLEGCFSTPQVVCASFCFPGTLLLRLNVDDFIVSSANLTDKNTLDAVMRGLDRLAYPCFLTNREQLRCLLVYLLLPIWRRDNFEFAEDAIKYYTRIIMLVAFLSRIGRKELIAVIRDECSVEAALQCLIPHCVAMTETIIEVCVKQHVLVHPLWESLLLLDIVWCGCAAWVDKNTVPKSSFAVNKLMILAPEMELELFTKHAQMQVLNVKEFVLEPWARERALKHPAQCGLSVPSQSFLAHPHLVPVAFKQKVLKAENLLTHQREMQSNIAGNFGPEQLVQAMIGNPIQVSESNIFFVLQVRRDYILQDAINGLTLAESADIRKPLRVKFEGEDGVDEGGVQREFFKLLMQQLFDPNFGMFKVDDESRALWFNPAADLLGVPEENFRLVGCIVGLAVYNNLPGVDVPFPRALFKKLKQENCTLDDLGELSPTYAQSIDRLLTWTPSRESRTREAINDEFENIFSLDFTVSYTAVGTTQTVRLDDGPDRAVNFDNREEFCSLLQDYILNESVRQMFDSFNEGFLKVCGQSNVLNVLAWDDLQRIVRAEEDCNFDHLRSTTRYEGGFTASDPYIYMFWEVLSTFNRTTKRQFLSFVTGSDFAPVGGLAELKLIVQKNGTEPTYALPTAHTCFNLLLLPEYSCRAKLERLLRTAVENSEGFGLQ